MQFDKFTIKSQEAIQESQAIAERLGHQEIKPEHLYDNPCLNKRMESLFPFFRRWRLTLPH